MMLLAVAGVLSAENILVTVHISGLTVGGGSVFIAVQNEENADNKIEEPFFSDMITPTSANIDYTVELPADNYMFFIFQDTNNNGQLDANLFKIPKEPVGMSNYDFKSIPGSFSKHKVAVSAENNHVDIAVRKF